MPGEFISLDCRGIHHILPVGMQGIPLSSNTSLSWAVNILICLSDALGNSWLFLWGWVGL